MTGQGGTKQQGVFCIPCWDSNLHFYMLPDSEALQSEEEAILLFSVSHRERQSFPFIAIPFIATIATIICCKKPNSYAPTIKLGNA